jgi:hypothetical protein
MQRQWHAVPRYRAAGEMQTSDLCGWRLLYLEPDSALPLRVNPHTHFLYRVLFGSVILTLGSDCAWPQQVDTGASNVFLSCS